MKGSSGNEEPMKSVAQHVEGFKSFLLEAARFYQNLIAKIKRYYGLTEEFSFIRGNSVSIEPRKMQKLQFLCHRFLICLGDLARYREQCENLDILKQNWSVAVTHYLEASNIWPHSGNPQNQLAVLATYVGDEFLALYHCIRSLAVKEPFPDAWNNLILLFERNRSFPLQSLSNDASNCKMLQGKHEELEETHLWPLFIRMISFFFIKSNLEDFPCTFASTIKELDILMALDDSKLKSAVEAYQRMDSFRTGPFRTLQIVSIFIFVIENLIDCPEARDSKNKNHFQQLEVIQEALTAAFTFVGRLANRCVQANVLDSCPLLPALLVFSEWLVSILDQVELRGSDEKSTSAMLSFFGAFLEILRQIDNNKSKMKAPGKTALWEDYELRGFAPLASSHVSLDFSTHWANADSYENGTECRAHRLTTAAMKIADRSNSSRKWICYDKSGRNFYIPESTKFQQKTETEIAKSPSTVVEMKESNQQHIQKMTEESEKLEEKPSSPAVVSKSVTTEDEEVILFKPLTRYNSAPLYKPIMANDEATPEDTGHETVPADECLRRATSVLMAQNEARADPSPFHSDLANFRGNKPAQRQDSVAHTFSEACTSSSSGPPSLNVWVLNRGSLSNDKVKGKRDPNKHSMPPIEEVASPSLDYLSISDNDFNVISSTHEPITVDNSSPAYAAPTPSAPFLPDDAVWFNGIQSNLTNLYDASNVSGHSNWTGAHRPLDYGLGIPGFAEGCPPRRPMTSSEWLRQYRENHNLVEWTPSHVWPANTYAAMNTGSGLFEQFGVPFAANPLIYEKSPPLNSGFPPGYGIVDHRREKLYHGHQRPSPYGCGAVNAPEPLLQYLKEKEWLLQQDPALRGPKFMGS
ncbi:nonsense-mediated mRNA decay factor SMG7-like isoform X2 [Mercurialis annua]|nr:nonsense-mediated mRNA decay factor SMG7-like isoform X2 [Mercurialis annua]